MAARKAPTRRTQEERSARTKAKLVATARRLFATRGFHGTSLDDLLEAVGGSRGALYHHFANKQALFRAAFEAEEQRLAQTIAQAAARQRGAWRAFKAGCEAFLEACLDPAMQRIILLDAPSVLGWQTMREIETRYVLTMIKQGIAAAIAEGRLRKRAVDPLALFLLGALSETAMSIARADDPPSAMRDAKSELDGILEALA